MIYPAIRDYLASCREQFHLIPEERKQMLETLAGQLRSGKPDEPVQMTFICTHNSRRSHFGQVWMKVAAEFAGLGDMVQTFSGGTEATACNPRTVAALERAGFHIHNPGGDNPHYLLHYSDDREPLACFSKRFDDPANPESGFVAVMTCSDADENCPFIPGAALRIPITYQDPKEADDTPSEAETYDKRCGQVAREMLYAVDLAAKASSS